MDPLGWVCEICAGRNRDCQVVQPLSRPGTVGVYLGTQRVHHFAATPDVGRFRSEADMNRQGKTGCIGR
jgi:hypothetical protein